MHIVIPAIIISLISCISLIYNQNIINFKFVTKICFHSILLFGIYLISTNIIFMIIETLIFFNMIWLGIHQVIYLFEKDSDPVTQELVEIYAEMRLKEGYDNIKFFDEDIVLLER